MLVGFDTEFGFRSYRRLPNGHLRGDISTMEPVCACVYFETGREIRLGGNFDQLQDLFDDPRYTFLIHGSHAEYSFCRRIGLRLPARFRDTLLMGVLVMHALKFSLPGGAYRSASLGELACRYGLPFVSSEQKDTIRESIALLQHHHEFGMARVLEYCAQDAKAVVAIYRQLKADMERLCGPNAQRNLTELYQPYALVMAEASIRGLRFDASAWCRLLELGPTYRDRLLATLRMYGYDHDGGGIGDLAFARLIRALGLEAEWPRTPTGKLSTKEDDIKLAATRHHHPAIETLRKQVAFDAFWGQDIGSLVDVDGRLRCGILPLAQRSGRNSTVSPNLMGVPGELRPLLLPDDGCRFMHFDYGQQEPGIAGFISGDARLMTDFATGDVYVNLGRRLGLIQDSMSKLDQCRTRNGILKALMLAILYGKGASSISRDLGLSYGDAVVLLSTFQRTYPRLFQWLKRYVTTSLERGWAENIIGFRAAFNVREGHTPGHIARSCQNFPIQSSSAACFQLTGIYLAQFGSDIRLPLHDAYLINVPNDSRKLADEHRRIASATEIASNQLFPGLAVKRGVEELCCFAKDHNEGSLEALLIALEGDQCQHA
jgi:DNA polymerase I